ncbi:MAG: sulfite exporter TauE/SafE family protein [Thermoproteus sp.]
MDAAALIALGIAVGLLMGLTGSSGVALTVPALSYMGYTYQRSVGVSLFVDFLSSLTTLAVYLKAKDVDGRYALALGAGAVLGAQLGSHVAVRTPEPPLEVLFALSSLYFAYTSLKNGMSGSDRGLAPTVRSIVLTLRPRARRALLLASSVGVGVLTGLIGASGGIMFMVIISALSDMPIRKTVGTATASMALSALSGFLAYSYLAKIDLSASVVIGASALVSGYMSARLAHEVPQRYLYFALAALFAVVAALELIRAFA